jgi:hypothetical protein
MNSRIVLAACVPAGMARVRSLLVNHGSGETRGGVGEAWLKGAHEVISTAEISSLSLPPRMQVNDVQALMAPLFVGAQQQSQPIMSPFEGHPKKFQCCRGAYFLEGSTPTINRSTTTSLGENTDWKDLCFYMFIFRPGS